MNANKYQPYPRSVVNKTVRGSLPPGSPYKYGTANLGSSANPLTSVYARDMDAFTVTSTNLTKSFDGPYSITGATLNQQYENWSQVVYSTSGSVANINNTATTFSTNSSGEAGLFFVYTTDYSASCFGQYLHTATPITYISTGSPALVVTISGSALQVAFASSTSAKTVYWKKLKFNA